MRLWKEKKLFEMSQPTHQYLLEVSEILRWISSPAYSLWQKEMFLAFTRIKGCGTKAIKNDSSARFIQARSLLDGL